LQFGTKVNGERHAIYASAAESVATKPGEVYEFTIDTEGIPDENAAIAQVLELENQVADMKVLYVETHPDNTITLQFMDTGPGSIALGGLFTLMPAIFILAGIVIAGYLVYRLYFSESGWLLPAIIIIGGAVAVFYFTSEKFFTNISDVTVRKEKEKVQEDKLSADQKEYSARSLFSVAKNDLDTARERLDTAKDKLDEYEDTEGDIGLSPAERKELIRRKSRLVSKIKDEFDPNYKEALRDFNEAKQNVKKSQAS
jgi:hypothetical protein